MLAYPVKSGHIDQQLNTEIIVVPASERYVEQMAVLQRLAYDDDDIMEEDQFASHLRYFPEGQFIALDPETDTVVGTTSGMRINFSREEKLLESWHVTTGDGWLSTHNPDGEWMYGVESCVHPEYRGRGVGSLLMDARFDVLRRLNLRGLVAGSIPMDYHKVAASMTIEDYVCEVVEGKRFDTNLSKQLHKGFQAHNLIPEYIYDPRSLNWAVAIVWDNPAYEPGKVAEAPLFKVPRLYRAALKSVTRNPDGAAGS